MSESELPPARYLDMFFRVLAGFLSDILVFIAYSYTSQSRVICIFFSLSLMVPFMAVIILKESINKFDIIGIIIGFIGMMLVIQPWRKPQNLEEQNEIIGDVIAFFGAITGALAVVANRTVSKSIHFTIVGFYYGFGQLFINPLVIILYQRTTFPDYSWELVGLILCCGVTYFVM